MKKGQVSIEYAVIIGFVTLVSIPLVIIYFDFTTASSEEITGRQLLQIAQKIVDSAESVYYLGEPSQTIVRVHIPTDVVESTIEGERDIVFKVKNSNGISEIVQFSTVNLTGSLPTNQGTYVLTIKATGGKVEISYT